MKLRIRKLANNRFITEVKRLFGWRLIHESGLTRGDAKNVTSGTMLYMGYILGESSDYKHHIRYSKGSLENKQEAIQRAMDYASKSGNTKNNITILGATQ